MASLVYPFLQKLFYALAPSYHPIHDVFPSDIVRGVVMQKKMIHAKHGYFSLLQ